MCDCQERHEADPGGQGARAVTGTVPPDVPLAEGVSIEGGGAEVLQPIGDPRAGPTPVPIPFPAFKVCRSTLRGGCYALSFFPSHSLSGFEGTLRVDRSAPDAGPDNIIVSGDLYHRPFRFPPAPVPIPDLNPLPIPDSGPIQPQSTSLAAAASRPIAELPLPPPLRTQIPIFPRGRYHSYLKVISIAEPVVVPARQPCAVTLVVEQYDYTPPPAGSFKGSFPTTASRTATITLTAVPGPPFLGPRFVGRWVDGGVDRGVVTLTWVSSFFRRATVEVDTLVGAVAPDPVPDGPTGMEFFETIYAKHGWQLTVIRAQTGVPVPAGVNPTDCWTAGSLHNLMTSVRDPATNLDTDWRIHLMVVPAKLGCGRGVMYDQIGVPREGCASFSDDGYPTSDSVNFGTAANQKQRDVPRAFLRSATHEITHTFNQIHQEQETTADNSIMTTTPSVADVLGGPTTGEPGVFPDQINLAVNTTVRHHLVHMPDPVIRPGGWPFASWFGTGVPQATDRHQFDLSELGLTVTGPEHDVVLGQPFELSWTLTNRSGGGLIVPNDITLEGLFASMTVTDPDGTIRPFRSFVIICDAVKLAEIQPGETVSASHRVFWSSEGFAFPRPGRYRVAVAVTWSARGIPVGVEGDVEVFVHFPTSDLDNVAAGLVLNTEVGKWVALGGDAYHLTEATSRLQELATRAAADVAPRLLAGFDGLMPDPDRLAGGGS